jgi:cytochrome P450
MDETIEREVGSLPLAPRNPLPFGQQMKAIREYHTGQELLRDTGGPVTRVTLGPRWLNAPIIWVTSPAGARDVLGRKDDACDRTAVHREMRHLMGDNLVDLPNEPWLSRKRTLQPLFTKQRVRMFSGHMAEAATMIADRWRESVEVDLDAEARRLTMWALGSSILGTNLDGRADALAEPLRTALSHIADRGTRPVRAPRWLPTPARRRAQAADATMHGLADEILRACRADPTRDAPLVRALIEATDPATGRALSDRDIANDLIAFTAAGYDTTATTLAFALWSLGHRRDVQDKVAAEASAIGDRELTPDDIPRLEYTQRVLREAMRLCPPVSVAGRTAMRDIEVDGYRAQEGSMVLVGIYAMQRDPALWENALVFDPDRFSPENMKSRDRWQYIPFGGGPRSCIGDHFAMLEATIALGTIVRAIDIQSLHDDFPLAVPFTTVAAAPIPARVRVRA